MKYRVVIDVSFSDKQAAKKLFIAAQKFKHQFEVPIDNPKGETLNIPQKVELWECYHDEDPPKPCVRIKANAGN